MIHTSNNFTFYCQIFLNKSNIVFFFFSSTVRVLTRICVNIWGDRKEIKNKNKETESSERVCLVLLSQ